MGLPLYWAERAAYLEYADARGMLRFRQSSKCAVRKGCSSDWSGLWSASSVLVVAGCMFTDQLPCSSTNSTEVATETDRLQLRQITIYAEEFWKRANTCFMCEQQKSQACVPFSSSRIHRAIDHSISATIKIPDGFGSVAVKAGGTILRMILPRLLINRFLDESGMYFWTYIQTFRTLPHGAEVPRPSY